MRAPPPGVAVIRSRYEEMVTFFPQWLASLLAPLEATYPPEMRALLHEQLRLHHAGSFSPDGKHKRSVLPGRFVEELRPDTIARLHSEHRAWWAELGYV